MSEDDLEKKAERAKGGLQDNIIVNDLRKVSLRGAKRRGNPVRLFHFVRNGDLLHVEIFKSLTIAKNPDYKPIPEDRP